MSTNNFEHDYRELIKNTSLVGKTSKGRNGETKSTFGNSLVVDTLQHGIFPVISGRRIYYKGVIGEYVAFLNKPKHVKDFEAQGCNYWEQWADPKGALRLDYGNKWVDWDGVNQLQNVVESLKEDPHGRRHIIASWSPPNVHNNELSLPNCHYVYQFYVDGRGSLDLIWIQRSVDLMIGLPSNIILAALLNIMVAKLTGYNPGKITMQLGDCHVYRNHADGMREYLNRDLTNLNYPTYSIKSIGSYSEFTTDSIELSGYSPLSAIKMPVSK